jgi:hypothetical protein
VTVPEIDGLSVTGSGDIIARSDIESRILDLVVSGSGDIDLGRLSAERIKAVISGSGDIVIEEDGSTDDLNAVIS